MRSVTPFFLAWVTVTEVCQSGLFTYSLCSTCGTRALPTQPGSPGLNTSAGSSDFLFLVPDILLATASSLSLLSSCNTVRSSRYVPRNSNLGEMSKVVLFMKDGPGPVVNDPPRDALVLLGLSRVAVQVHHGLPWTSH